MAIRKVQRGEPITAELWNELVDAIGTSLRIGVDGTMKLIRGRHGVLLHANSGAALGLGAYALLLSNLARSDPTCYVQIDDLCWGSVNGDPNYLLVYNVVSGASREPYVWEGWPRSTCFVIWSAANRRYELLWVECNELGNVPSNRPPQGTNDPDPVVITGALF